MPKDLLDQMQYIEEIFTVDTAKLKAISEHFVSELTKGTVRRPLTPRSLSADPYVARPYW